MALAPVACCATCTSGLLTTLMADESAASNVRAGSKNFEHHGFHLEERFAQRLVCELTPNLC